MAISNTSYTYRVRDGRFEEARDLLKEMKANLMKYNPKSVRAYYAAAAGEATGTIVLSIEHPTATNAGKAADTSWEDPAVHALAAKASSGDSPLESFWCGIYTDLDI